MTPCILRTDPKTVLGRKLDDSFILVETLSRTSHSWRHVLKCRCCDQTYLLDFSEKIDWANGRDPQNTMLIPVSNSELETLRSVSSQVLATHIPRLVKDWPSDQDAPSIFWIDR